MTFFRVEHNKNYTVVNNTICNDTRLSWKAKGLWLYAFSRPNDWKFHLSHLIDQATDGRDAVKAGLRELENCGYLVREKTRKEGKFSKADWVFYETPQELKKCSPRTGFPSPVFPSPENPPLTSTEEQPSTEQFVCCAEAPEKISAVPMQKAISCEVISPEGKRTTLKCEDLYTLAVQARKDWTAAEIEMAWGILSDYKKHIRSWEKFTEGVIINARQKQKSQKICGTEKEKICQTKIRKDYQEKILKSSSGKQKSDSMGKGTPMLHLAQLFSPLERATWL